MVPIGHNGGLLSVRDDKSGTSRPERTKSTGMEPLSYAVSGLLVAFRRAGSWVVVAELDPAIQRIKKNLVKK
jgi:hypothetical protein